MINRQQETLNDFFLSVTNICFSKLIITSARKRVRERGSLVSSRSITDLGLNSKGGGVRVKDIKRERQQFDFWKIVKWSFFSDKMYFFDNVFKLSFAVLYKLFNGYNKTTDLKWLNIIKYTLQNSKRQFVSIESIWRVWLLPVWCWWWWPIVVKTSKILVKN